MGGVTLKAPGDPASVSDEGPCEQHGLVWGRGPARTPQNCPRVPFTWTPGSMNTGLWGTLGTLACVPQHPHNYRLSEVFSLGPWGQRRCWLAGSLMLQGSVP